MNITKDNLINKVGDLQVLPAVARKALDILNRDNCSIDDVITLIEKDQAIAARILKISNSALYGLRQEVTSLQHAMMILGFKTIKGLVLTATTRSLYKKFGIAEKMMWDHSVAVGIASKLISKNFGSEFEDRVFVGGLMHDLGKVMMNNETPEQFSEVMENIYNDGMDSITAEREVYGFDHTEVGAGVVEKWKFSHILIDMIGKHHLDNSSLEKIGNDLTAKSIACVSLANNMCKYLGIGYRKPDKTIVLHRLASSALLGIGQEKIDKLLEDVQETFAVDKSAFE